jgi:hypothetical protein
MLSLCEQQTTPTNDSNDYGYFEYSDSAHEDKKDLNERVENWVNPYLDNLSFDYKQFYSEFGITPINLQLPNVEL